MKAEGIIMLILMFAVVTITTGGIISDMNNNYDVNVSTSWSDKYNFANQINESVANIQKDADVATQTTGWMQIVSGVSAIWQGIKTVITLLYSIPGYTISIIRGVAADMGLPSIVSDMIIPIFIVMILVAITFIVIRTIRGEGI